MVRRLWVVVPLIACVVAGCGDDNPFPFPEEERQDYFISFDHPLTHADCGLVESAGGDISDTFDIVPVIEASLTPTQVSALRNGSGTGITSVEAVPSFEVSLHTEYDASWGIERIETTAAHEVGITGFGGEVAVFDTGFNYHHPDLVQNYAGGYDFVNDDGDPFDDNGHGSHVAGIIAAALDGAGLVGVAPHARIHALKVLDDRGRGTWSAVFRALDYVLAHDIPVVNISLGGDIYPGSTLEQAFDNARARGILVVASAGNGGSNDTTEEVVDYPAAFESVIAVGSVDRHDERAISSATGSEVEVVAPGVGIFSTLLDDDYAIWSGTSMAAPHVAGLAVLLVSVGVDDLNGNRRHNDEIRFLITETAIPLGVAHEYGHGLMNVPSALVGSFRLACDGAGNFFFF